MMTREMVMELLATAGADLDVDTCMDGTVRVTVQDFEGFDEDWCEVEGDFDEELVDSIQETLEESALSAEGDYYRYYEFDEFTVVWGYASMDV